MFDVSKVKQQEAATRASLSNRQPLRSNATQETEDTSCIRMDVITPPPHPPPPPPDPRTELKESASLNWHVQKVESRQNHRKNRCEMRHTHRKPPKKTMRNGELSMFLYSAARRLLQFFC